MRGAVNDVLGFTIQQAEPGDTPENRFVTQNNYLGFVDVSLGRNPKEELARMRTVPMMVLTRPQGQLTRLQNQEEQVFASGGLAHIPQGGLWPNLFGKGV